MIVQNSLAAADVHSLSEKPWDVIVIGAGPAGGVAALGAVRNGLRTLLLDRKQFPRPKVCGACINRRAMAGLAAAGLAEVVQSLEGVPLRAFQVHSPSSRANIPFDFSSVAIGRGPFDDAIVRQVVAAGGTFLPGVTATVAADLVGERRRVKLRTADRELTAHTSLVIAADGLSQSCLRSLPEFTSRVARGTRVGVGGQLSADKSSMYQPGTIYMAVDRAGYVGVVRLADGRLNVAAAFDPQAIKHATHQADLVAATLRAADFEVPASLFSAEWSGTAGLTRRSNRVASKRVLVVGDAGGYVEPFTGEGIAWAVTTGAAAGAIATEGVAAWTSGIERKWTADYARLVRRHQFWCRALVRMLRSPMMVNSSLRLLNKFPKIARPVLKHLNAPVNFGPSGRGQQTRISKEKSHGV